MFPNLLSRVRLKNDIKVVYIIFGIVLTYFSIYMPDFMTTADSGSVKISSVVSFGALNGMLFGPYWGSVISATGLSLYELTSGEYHGLDAFTILSPLFIALSSIVAGLIVNREHKAAKVIFSALIVAWYIFDVGREAYFFPWYHVLVLVAFIAFEKSILLKDVTSKVYIFVSFFFASLMGVLSDHLAGSLAYHLVKGLGAGAYKSVIFVYPLERTILAFFPAFLVYVLIVVFKDILLSSDTIQQDIEEMKSRDLEDYLHDDVLKIIKKSD